MKSNKYKLVAKTFHGLENSLRDELKTIGIKKINLGIRAVTFEGDIYDIYKVNYLSRLSLRILKEIKSFKVDNENELYEKLKDVDWREFININQTFVVDSVISNSKLKNSHYVSQKSKDAIVDFFREKEGKRPNVDKENPDIIIHIHISNNTCNVLLDSSGEPLYKRGYRKAMGDANINEVLASGLIYLSEWNKKIPFIDFMCGSATIPIEAAMIAMNIPAGYYRSKFAFMNWNDFNEVEWYNLKSKYDSQIRDEAPIIIASDISTKAVEAAYQNIKQARLHKDIILKHISFQKFRNVNKEGVIITNPPYGERLKPSNIISIYKELGHKLKSDFPGFDAWIISSNEEALKKIGLKANKKFSLFNGQIKCKFVNYRLWGNNYENNFDIPDYYDE